MITMHTAHEVEQLHAAQKQFFNSGTTRSIAYRKQKLQVLQNMLQQHEKEICDALWNDLHKSEEEAYLTEISLVQKEIKLHLKKLSSWARMQRVHTPWYLFPSSSFIMPEPRGLSLILSPWNYPMQLLLMPLVGAISAGNCAILKPSEHTPHTALLLEQLISRYFDKEYIAVVQGHEHLLQHRFDLIFFTGSTAVGKSIMQAAATHLTPLILELGGKSPCIVDKSANIDIAARRIAWGKCVNAGQTCIAPDHVYVHRGVKELFCERFAYHVTQMFGSQPQESKHYARIIHNRAFDRISAYLQEGEIIYGGNTHAESLYIQPTLLHHIKPHARVMQEEIFGPILPLIEFEDEQEVQTAIQAMEKPLSFYYFGNSMSMKNWLQQVSAGGVCINDTLMQFVNPYLPFGGVGYAGMGKYHGKESFIAFSHMKSIVRTPLWPDLPFKYAPYKYFSWIKKFI